MGDMRMDPPLVSYLLLIYNILMSMVSELPPPFRGVKLLRIFANVHLPPWKNPKYATAPKTRPNTSYIFSS